MAVHLLQCPQCDEAIHISTRHAGQTRTCPSCQADVDVPTLGALKQLPLAEEQTARAPAAPNRLRSWLFSGGLLLATVMGVGGFALQTYANTLYSDVGQIKEQFEMITSDRIDEMKHHEVFEWWQDMNAQDLGEWREHPGVGYNVQSQILTYIAYGMYVLAGLGLFALASSFLVGQRVG